jgi:hypothetical protein
MLLLSSEVRVDMFSSFFMNLSLFMMDAEFTLCFCWFFLAMGVGPLAVVEMMWS